MFEKQQGGFSIKREACDGDIACPLRDGVTTTYSGIIHVLEAAEVIFLYSFKIFGITFL